MPVETMSPSAFSYVYLLPHSTEPRFKIGKADDVTTRARALPESFDLCKARALRFDSAESAFNAERVLHRLAARHKITGLPWGDGYTEWFDLACFSDILAVVENHLNTWLGLLDVSALPATLTRVVPIKTEGPSPTSQKIFARRRAATESVLLGGRWVSPTENHACFKEMLRLVLEDVISITPNVEVGWHSGDFRFWANTFPRQKTLKFFAPPSRRLWALATDPGSGPVGAIKHAPVFGWCNDVRNGAFLSILDHPPFIYVCDIVQAVWVELGGNVWISIQGRRDKNSQSYVRKRVPFSGSVSQFLSDRLDRPATSDSDLESRLRELGFDSPF